MALRNPTLQTRGQFGHFWGVYANAGALPNVSTIAPANKIGALEQGDIAYVQNAGFYQCDAPGVTSPPDGLAVWSAVAGQDRFAPSFLVGNTAAGDSAVAYNSGGFRYFPDTGNGAQIVAALAAAAATADRGLVYIRRGTYDLGAVGGPAAPLAVVSGVEVCGEGDATIIEAATVNQGVFTLASTSALKQVQLVAAAEATSAGSTAMVVATGEVVVDDVYITLATDAAGALREAIRFTAVGVAAPRVSALRVVISTVTGSADPTVGIAVDTAGLQASNISVNGGDIALDLTSGSASITNFLAYNWEVSAARASGGTIQIDQGYAIPSPPGSSAVAFDLVGGVAHALRAIDTENGGSTQLAGVRTGAAATVSRVKIERCRIDGYTTGVLLGDTAGGGDVNNASVIDCQISANRYGIHAAEGALDCVFAKNRIILTQVTGPADAAIRIEGGSSARHTIEGNSISVSDTLSGAYGIRNVSQQTRITGNEITIGTGLHGLHSTGERNTITGNTIAVSESTSALTIADGALYNIVNGNVCLTTDSPYVGPILFFGGDYGVCNNNITVVTDGDPTSSPGIQLTAASSNVNCIGNVCRGSSVAPIVDDDGGANSVAQNIGAA